MPAHTLTDNAIRKLRRALSGRLGGSGGGAGGPATVAPILYPPPFTVRFAASLATAESSEGAGDGTDGEWIIYLPTTGLVKVGGTDADFDYTLTAAGGDYPDGWYLIHDDEDAPIVEFDAEHPENPCPLYLLITATGEPSIKFAIEPSEDIPAPIAVKLCDLYYDPDSGRRTVKQYVSSSIVFGTAGNVVTGGGCFALVEDEPTETSTGEIVDLILDNTYYKVGEVLEVADPDDTIANITGLQVSNGGATATLDNPYVALKVSATSSSPSATTPGYASYAELKAATEDPDYVVIPLYFFYTSVEPMETPQGESQKYRVRILVGCDFRNMPKATMLEIL